MFNELTKTMKAVEALEAKRRVKIDTSETTADPVKIKYADAGEDYIGVTEFAGATNDLIAVKLNDAPGTLEVECVINSAINVGTTIYGAADGKISDASSGTAQGIALQKAAVSNEHIEIMPWNVKSTTAATVSIADGGNHTAQTTVEAALQEIYAFIDTSPVYIPIPLLSLRTGANYAVAASNANFSLIGSDTTPAVAPINGGTDGCMRVTWITTDVDPVFFEVPLPPDLNPAEDLVLHCRGASESTDKLSFTMKSFFNEADGAVSDTLAVSAATSTYTEGTGTIAAADVPTGAQTVTIELTPASHDTDIFYLTGLWFEHSRAVLSA